MYHVIDGWTCSRVNSQLVEMKYLVSVLYRYSIVDFGVFIFLKQISFNCFFQYLITICFVLLDCSDMWLLGRFCDMTLLLRKYLMRSVYITVFFFPLHYRSSSLCVHARLWMAFKGERRGCAFIILCILIPDAKTALCCLLLRII